MIRNKDIDLADAGLSICFFLSLLVVPLVALGVFWGVL